MEIPIGIRWAIMNHKRFLRRPILPLPFIEVIGTSLDILLPEFWKRSRADPTLVSLNMKLRRQLTYGNVDLGNLNVADHDFDMVVSRPLSWLQSYECWIFEEASLMGIR